VVPGVAQRAKTGWISKRSNTFPSFYDAGYAWRSHAGA
jgi:hypothetical protein